MNSDKVNIKRIVVKLERNARSLLGKQDTTYGLKRALKKLLKEFRLYQNYINGIRDWERKKQRVDTQKIQIGGGKHYLKGFLNIDIVPPADLICDVREGLPLKDGCSEFIFTEHFLEHIDYPASVKRFIKECFRVLKKEGKLVIGVPDSELVVKSYLKKDPGFYKMALESWYTKRNCLSHFNTYIDLLNYHFRDQDDDEKYSPHLWAYDFEKLKSLLENVGFKKVRRWRFDPSIANPERKWGSLYVIAIK